MGKALYRKYRSKSLDEIIGQEHITDTLRRAIATGRISHAYLFTGPRGVGKTSIARILAHELNGVEYTGEDNHLDIIEIDAASNGGVEEIRDLRDKVYITPSSGKYKVYIIDEVHMMTTSAFNALLKTLEEPPEHTVFILATTEAHKLPATIVSRTQRFTFKPIPREKAVAHLRYIAQQEKINVTDDALELIAEHGEGSFRDSIGMLDQAASSGERIDRTVVEQLLGIPPTNITDTLLGLLYEHDVARLITLLGQLRTDGYQAGSIAKRLGQTLRDQLVHNTATLSREQLLKLLSRLIDIPASHNPDQLLELILLETALDTTHSSPVEVPPPRPAASHPLPIEATVAPKAAEKAPITASQPEVDAPPHEPAAADTGKGTQPISVDTWQALLDSLKKQYNTLYGIIRMSRPEFQPGKVVLTFGYSFHQKRANDAKNKKILTAILEEVTGQRVAIVCLYDPNTTPLAPQAAPKTTPTQQQPDTNAALGTISTIFGGGEVLPS